MRRLTSYEAGYMDGFGRFLRKALKAELECVGPPLGPAARELLDALVAARLQELRDAILAGT
jgi:hypothetical protein